MQQGQYKQKLTYGYWGLRGLGQPLRYILEITGTEYEEKTYKEKEHWFDQDKKNLGLDFPNVPYIIDGDFKLTESQAIARYIINRSGKTQLLGGNDDKKRAVVDMLQSQVMDLFKEMVALIYNKEFANIKNSHYKEKLQPKLQGLSRFQGNNKFLTGVQVTLPDIFLYEFISQISLIFPEEFKEFENLKNLIKNVEEIPYMKAFINSSRFIKSPFNATMYGAQWNN